MVNINTRLKNIINTLYNGNKRAFATTIGVNPTVIENIVGARQSKPSYDVLCKICSNANISEQWLISGTGEMLKNKQDSSASNIRTEQNGIPLIPFDAMAGYLSGEMSINEDECERLYMPGLKADFVIRISGNSMEPRYYDGDYVACEKASLGDMFFEWDKAYVVDTERGVLIKRVNPGATDSEILLESDNKKYRPVSMPIKSIYHIALVKGVVRIE